MSSSCEQSSSEAPRPTIPSTAGGVQEISSDGDLGYFADESATFSSSPLSGDSVVLQSMEQDDGITPGPEQGPLSNDLFMRLMRPSTQLMISPANPTLTPAEQALKRREELFSHVPWRVQKTKHSVRTTRRALADSATTPSSPPSWLNSVNSQFLSKKWPQIFEHHHTIKVVAEKQSRLRELERELQTPEARSVLLKLKERSDLKKAMCMSYTDIADEIFAEEDPDLMDMLLELYQQEVGEDLLGFHAPPDPAGFFAVINDLLYDSAQDLSHGSNQT